MYLVPDFSFSGFGPEIPAPTSMEQNLERQKVNSPHLKNIRPDTGSFREHFRRNAGKVLSIFKNLGGDSILIAPNPPFKNDDFDFNSNRLYRDWTINRWFISNKLLPEHHG